MKAETLTYRGFNLQKPEPTEVIIIETKLQWLNVLLQVTHLKNSSESINCGLALIRLIYRAMIIAAKI